VTSRFLTNILSIQLSKKADGIDQNQWNQQ
jgi:hypothetical protein